MANIHYVWWGLPTQVHHMKAANSTPNKMASACGRHHNIMYWHQAGNFRPVLALGINANPIRDPSEIIRDTPAWHGQGLAIRNIVNALTRYNAYAAVKDLVSLLVLYRHGGYYFDTTTLLAPADRGRMRQLPNYVGPKIIARGVGRVHRFDRINDRSAMATYKFGRSGNKTLPAIDVWAMFVPPQHQAIATAIESYINRARNFGLDKYPATKTALAPAVPVSIHTVMTSANKTTRNRILGTIIIAAIQEGLATESVPSAVGWQIQDMGSGRRPPTGCEGAVTYCQEIHLYKRHAGFWRHA